MKTEQKTLPHNIVDNIPPNLPVTPDSPAPLFQLVELRLKGLSYTQIGKIVGRSKQTIQERLSPYSHHIKGLQGFKDRKADILSVKQSELLESLSPEAIKKMSGLQITTAFSQLYDKERLERGQSTANIAYSDQSTKLTELDAEIQALEAELGVVDDDDGAE